MSSRLVYCADKGLCSPPNWLADSIVLEVIGGSKSYGCQTDASDEDVLGICIPPKEYVLPWTVGIIPGFQDNPFQFDQYQQPHIKCNDSGKEFDFTIYNIIKFFNLAYENNPNIIDILFVPQFCVTKITQVGNIIRDNRKLFLSKLCIPKFRNYSRSQIGKMENKNPIGKRKLLVEKYGFDTKYASHLIRLILQCEQILLEENLDLTRSSQVLNGIRGGEWTKERVLDFYYTKERDVEGLILKSNLRATPDKNKIKDLLLECLEVQYGKITNDVAVFNDAENDIREIQKIVSKYV